MNAQILTDDSPHHALNPDQAEGHQSPRIEFAVMDHTGDTKTIWDPSQPAEVEAARAMFDKLTKPPSQGGSGYAAFRVTDQKGEKGELVRSFDPSHERLIFSPPMVGG